MDNANRFSHILTLKYAFLHAFFWMSFASINVFAAVFLRTKNFDNTQIGMLLALAATLSIFLQPFLAYIADHAHVISLRSITLLIMILTLFLALLLLILPSSFILTLLLFGGINVFLFSLPSLLNSLSMEFINQGIPINYGLARGIGSMSFAIISLILGRLTEHMGAKILLPCFLFVFTGTTLCTVAFKQSQKNNFISSSPTKRVKLSTPESSSNNTFLNFFLQNKKFFIVLCGFTLLFTAHNAVNTYLINILENVGGNAADLGISLGLAAALELPIMAAFIFVVRKISCNILLKFSAFFFLLKLFFLMIATNIPMVLLSQSFQLFSYALIIPASVYYVNERMDNQNKVTGQALMGIATVGLPVTLGSLIGGSILDTFNVITLLVVGFVLTLVGFVLIIIGTTKQKALGDAKL